MLSRLRTSLGLVLVLFSSALAPCKELGVSNCPRVRQKQGETRTPSEHRNTRCWYAGREGRRCYRYTRNHRARSMLKAGNLCQDKRAGAELQSVCRECRQAAPWVPRSRQRGTGRTAAVNHGLFLTTTSKAGAGDFVCLSLFISSSARDG